MTPQEAGHINLLAISGLRAREVGVLGRALVLMLKHGGPITRDELRDGNSIFDSDRRSFPRDFRVLIRKGKLHVTDDGLLIANPLVIEAFAIVFCGAPVDDAL